MAAGAHGRRAPSRVMWARRRACARTPRRPMAGLHALDRCRSRARCQRVRPVAATAEAVADLHRKARRLRVRDDNCFDGERFYSSSYRYRFLPAGSPLSTGATAGIAVGAGVGVIGAAVATACYCRRKRRALTAGGKSSGVPSSSV
jgi:hypothetical protein